MSVQFEWQLGSDDGQWETVVSTQPRPRRPWPWWAWALLTVLIAGVGTWVYLSIRDRYERAAQLVRFQIQSTIDLEARAFALGDEALFLEQQDEAATDWYETQKRRISPDCEAQGTQQVPGRYCTPLLPAKADRIDLQGDVAWVEVIEGDPPVYRVRFYRRTDLGWKHTAPHPAFWQRAEQERYGRVTVRTYRRDRPYVDALLERIAQAEAEVCETIDCPTTSRLEVAFSVDAPPLAQSYLDASEGAQGNDRLVLSTPWLSGIPVDGSADDTEAIYWVTYALSSRAMRATLGGQLNSLQEAVIADYARWYATGDTSQAPILGRIVDKQGPASLQEVLRSLREARSLDAFVSFWLDVSSERQIGPFFETLLGIERDALQQGNQDVFLLLQDDRQMWWVEQQRARFRSFQELEPSPRLPDVYVLEVERDRDLARVTLAPSSVSAGHLGPVQHFRLRSGEWRHSSPLLGERTVDH